MNTEQHSHRFADVILNSDYELRTDIESIVKGIQLSDIETTFAKTNVLRVKEGRRNAQGMQSSLNQLFREEFGKKKWESEKNVFSDPENDLVLDFLKEA